MTAPLPTLTRASFRGSTGGMLKRLPGWRSHFVVPREASSHAQAFAERLATPLLEERLEEFHDALRQAFGYRRKQLETSLSSGLALCRTPDFELTLTAELDPDDPSRLRETLCVAGLADLEAVSSDAFGQVFDGRFDEVLFEYSQPFDLEAVVDTLEEREVPGLRLRYPPDLRRCRLELPAEGVCLEFEGATLRVLLETRPGMEALGRILRRGLALLGTPGSLPRLG